METCCGPVPPPYKGVRHRRRRGALASTTTTTPRQVVRGQNHDAKREISGEAAAALCEATKSVARDVMATSSRSGMPRPRSSMHGLAFAVQHDASHWSIAAFLRCLTARHRLASKTASTSRTGRLTWHLLKCITQLFQIV
jgi:hypothetical protein